MFLNNKSAKHLKERILFYSEGKVRKEDQEDLLQEVMLVLLTTEKKNLKEIIEEKIKTIKSYYHTVTRTFKEPL